MLVWRSWDIDATRGLQYALSATKRCQRALDCHPEVLEDAEVVGGVRNTLAEIPEKHESVVAAALRTIFAPGVTVSGPVRSRSRWCDGCDRAGRSPQLALFELPARITLESIR